MQLSPKIVPLGLGYLLTVLAFFLLDNLPEIARANRSLRGINAASILYQRAVTFGSRKAPNNYVALVLLDDKVSDDIRNNYCLQRRYLATVVSKVRDARPSIIALDFLFGEGTCPESSDAYHGTSELQSAIADVSRTVPIVIAQKTTDAFSLEEASPGKLAALQAAGFKDSEVIIEPSERFDSAGTNVRHGLYTFNEDTRRIPLSWWAYSSQGSVGHEKPSMMDTFSVAVAKAYHPDPRILSQIQDFQRSGRDPLTSFLTEPEMRCFSSFDLLNKLLPSGPGKCQSADAETNIMSQLEHRVVVIGKDAPDIDRHDSIIGVVPGAVLQANYIESILDSRFLKPVQGWLSVSIALLWLGLIELIFKMSVGHPHRALSLAILATVMVWILLYDLVLIQWGFYLVLWPPSIIAILWRYVLVLSETTIHAPQAAPVASQPQPVTVTQKQAEVPANINKEAAIK